MPEENAPTNDELLLQLSALRHQLMRAEIERTSHADALLAAIVESSDDAIISKTLEGIILSWNNGAQRIFGYTAEEAIGKPMLLVIPPDRHHEEPHILSRIRAGDRIDHYETVRVCKDGRRIDVSVTVSPVRNQEGKIVAASKIARDITAQKQIQRDLQAAKESAEAANKAKDQFLSILSHELRTPLTPILAEMSYLETQENLPAELREHIAMVRRNAETEARLVDDLLDLTRLARGKILLHFEALDIHDVIRGAAQMFTAEMEAKKLRFITVLNAKERIIRADPGRLQQIFLNLLSNATKFTPPGGQIEIHTSNPAPGQLRIEVVDTGIGIAKDLLPKLFIAFEQPQEARRLGGLGLGLSISRSLVNMHKGSIRAESTGKGQGAKFIIEFSTLPITSEQAINGVGPRAAALKRLDCRILLVEDDLDTRQVMQRLLSSFGCTVLQAGSVQEALSIADTQPFDLLISDIGLPDGSGMQIVSKIKESKPIRSIAVSGFGQDDDVRRSREAGFDAHLVKPINFNTLREAVQGATAGMK